MQRIDIKSLSLLDIIWSIKLRKIVVKLQFGTGNVNKNIFFIIFGNIY